MNKRLCNNVHNEEGVLNHKFWIITLSFREQRRGERGAQPCQTGQADLLAPLHALDGPPSASSPMKLAWTI
jgi:hypothetical protein